MSKQNLVSKAVRLALVVGAAGFAANAALADDTTSTTTTTTTTTDNQSTAQLGKIEVTGTKIKRTEIEQAQPVNIVTSAQIRATGLTTVGQVVQKLTSSGASLSTLDNFGGNFTFTGGGQSTVDLRNLGAQRVLVLVNGKRWVTGLDGTVDLNTIPVSVIDHVEILQDGASAIYGSDAIAGVVNIITVKDFNGREASAYMGIYNGDSHWDGRTQSYDFTFGSSNTNSGLLFNASYTDQQGISSADRGISREPILGLGNAGGSSAAANGRFRFVAPTTSPWSAFCGNTTCNLSINQNATPGADGKLSMSDFHPFTSDDRFNYAPFNYVLTPEERFSTYLQGYTDLADNLTFKADMMYAHRDSHQQAAPEPLFFASSSIALDIPASQAYNPFGFDLDAAHPSSANLALLGRRMVENGPRLYHEKEDTFHIDTGFSGYFNAAGGEWDWDANYAFSKDSEVDVNNGHFDVSHLRLALGPSYLPAGKANVASNYLCGSAANPISGCVPLNVFGPEGSITPQMLDYIGYTAQNQFENDQRVYNLDLTNSDLMQLPGGGLGLAVGYEQLEHDGTFLPDSVAQNGYDSFNPGRPVLPTVGRETSQAEFAELDMPLLGGFPGVKLLDLDIAGRHTKYDTFGTSNTYRWGLKYQPNDEWLVRTSWSQGFRAPTIQDLFSAGTNFSANILDPCTTVNPANNAAVTPAPTCAVKGVPVYAQPNAQINTLEIGNPHLKPETSISRTLGFVFSPDWLPGFNLSADYYKIEVDNIIQPISGQIILNSCYTQTLADSNAADCALITRTAFGAIQTLRDQVTNVGNTSTSGIDITAAYAFPSTAVGDFKLTFDDTHIRNYTATYPNDTGPATVVELAGVERGGSVFPFGVPRDKIRTALDWNAGAWSAQYALRYVSHLTEVPSDAHIGAVTYHDVQGSYDMESIKTTFTLGVRNLFAKEPPPSSVQELNSFDPTLYDVPGRFIYGRISVKF
jgi:iron complex outermembrane recepter protein